MISTKDFTPTKETISLHGLGFIQLVLPANQRLHVWHPDLPRRDCYEHSGIHNHRFSFTSRVLVGEQKNVRVDLELARDGSHTVISHNGPRSDKGGRLSYPVADCNVHERAVETYGPGEEYFMPVHEYHHTPNTGVVVTVMRKVDESAIHANSVIRKGIDFHYEFDRFQLSPERLFGYVVDALAEQRKPRRGYWQMTPAEQALVDASTPVESASDTHAEELQRIDDLLRGKVCDPDPVKPMFRGGLVHTTTYGLVSGLLRERDALKAR